jgi:hypothetical protein
LKSIGGNLGIGIGPTDSHRSRDSATAYPYPRNGLSDGENNTAALLRSPKRTSHFFLEPLFIGQRTGSFSSSSDLSEVSSDYLTVSWNGSTSPTELSEYLAYPGVSSRSSSPTPIESPQEILYVDPWSLEHNPNPVIFAHLGDSLYSVGPELHGVLANSPECDISTVHDNKRGRIPKTYFDLEPYKHTDLDYSEVTSLPSPADVEFNSDMARASTIDPSYISIRTQDKWSENAVPEISGSPPTTKALDIRPRSAACEDLVCEQCHITFQTIGLKNKHDNRKHVRRFACTGSNCTARFNLKADLQRHKSTVHKDTMTTLKQDTWSCTNAHCHLPGKLFTRKDNFQRHLVRCQNAQ